MGRRKFDITRRSHVREPNRRFYLFCEGQNTEPGYFDAVRTRYRAALIEIHTFGPVGVPGTIAKTAIAYKEKLKEMHKSGKTSSFEEKDEVWAIFDRDCHGCYYDAIKKCKAANINIARSNPCFEVWIILHEQDYDKPQNRWDVQKQLRKVRPDYHPKKKTLKFDELVGKLEIVEKRAVKQFKARIAEGGKPMGPPYTTVDKLTRAIRLAAEASQ